MFRLPHAPVLFVCWCVLWLMVAVFARWLTRTVLRELRRRRFTESVRIIEAPRPTCAPHWTRDPSPRPRARV